MNGWLCMTNINQAGWIDWPNWESRVGVGHTHTRLVHRDPSTKGLTFFHEVIRSAQLKTSILRRSLFLIPTAMPLQWKKLPPSNVVSSLQLPHPTPLWIKNTRRCRLSSTRPVYRDSIRFVRIVNVRRQLVQSTVMLYVSFALSTYVVNSSSLPWYYTFRSHRQRMSSTRPVYRDAIRFVCIVNVCRHLVQSTVMLHVSFASSTSVVNLSSLPWCCTFRPHSQRLSSTRKRSIESTAYNKSSSSWLMNI